MPPLTPLQLLAVFVDFNRFSLLCTHDASRLHAACVRSLFTLKIITTMAKGNMLLGTLRKKLGDVVFYRRNGEQCSRVRVREIANPKTDGQMIQRLVLSAAAKATTELEMIIDHSFQNITYKEKSKRHFRSLAMKAIRAQTIAAYKGENYGLAPVMPFNGYGAMVAPYEISSGSLDSARLTFEAEPQGNDRYDVIANASFKTLKNALNKITLAELLSGLGISLVEGSQQQLTFVFSGAQPMDGVGDSEIFYSNQFYFTRLNFNASALLLPAFTLNEGVGTLSFNEAVLDMTRSNFVGRVTVTGNIDGGNAFLQFHFAGDNNEWISSAAAIVSQYANGSWKRSTERLFVQIPSLTPISSPANFQESAGYNFIDSVLASLNGATLDNDWLLNRSQNTAQGSASTGGGGNRRPQHLPLALVNLVVGQNEYNEISEEMTIPFTDLEDVLEVSLYPGVVGTLYSPVAEVPVTEELSTDMSEIGSGAGSSFDVVVAADGYKNVTLHFEQRVSFITDVVAESRSEEQPVTASFRGNTVSCRALGQGVLNVYTTAAPGSAVSTEPNGLNGLTLNSNEVGEDGLISFAIGGPTAGATGSFAIKNGGFSTPIEVYMTWS